MAHDMEEVLGRLAEAVHRFVSNKKLAEFDPGEVALTFELGWHIRDLFKDAWDVNGEYDRIGKNRKFMDDPDLPPAKRGIRPDIIVHKIGERNNLMVVEAKRSELRRFGRDFSKLAWMTRQDREYGYFVGIHLVINVVDLLVARCMVFTDGKPDAKWTEWLWERLPRERTA